MSRSTLRLDAAFLKQVDDAREPEQSRADFLRAAIDDYLPHLVEGGDFEPAPGVAEIPVPLELRAAVREQIDQLVKAGKVPSLAALVRRAGLRRVELVQTEVAW